VDTALPGLQESFADDILGLGKPTVIVLCNGGALAIDSLIERPNAIIEAFSPSLKGAQAIAASMFGKANRWGKLPVTMYPHDYIQQQPMTNYDMAKAPGRTYKYYTGTPLFPFGHGLSLTSFSLHCDATSAPYGVAASCQVANLGQLDGDEVVMVFHNVSDAIRHKATHPIPLKALVAFQRVSVAVGNSTSFSLPLPSSIFEVVDENGDKRLYPGSHSLIFSRGHGDTSVHTSTRVQESDDGDNGEGRSAGCIGCTLRQRHTHGGSCRNN